MIYRKCASNLQAKTNERTKMPKEIETTVVKLSGACLWFHSIHTVYDSQTLDQFSFWICKRSQHTKGIKSRIVYVI